MAVFKFECEHCKSVFKKLLPKKVDVIICECGKEAKLLLPSSATSTIYEMKDAQRGKQIPKDQDKKLKTRMHDHIQRYETEEKIDQHGADEMIRNGWDKKIKKI